MGNKKKCYRFSDKSSSGWCKENILRENKGQTVCREGATDPMSPVENNLIRAEEKREGGRGGGAHSQRHRVNREPLEMSWGCGVIMSAGESIKRSVCTGVSM